MAYIKPDFREIDNILDIIIRGRKIKAKVIKPPFVKKDWNKIENRKILKNNWNKGCW